MSRGDPLQAGDRRAGEPNGLDPSMQEILASIRRIIADGQGLWSGAQDDTSPEVEEARDPRERNGLAPGPAIREKAALQASAPRSTAAGRNPGALASAATEASVAAALQALVASRFVQSTDLVAELAREMIRPMLEAWIDENLPGIVERLVAAEIARISRGE